MVRSTARPVLVLRTMPARKYIVGELAGIGGMGFVHKATVGDSPNAYAIKQLRPEMAKDPEVRRRFENEIRIGQKLDHPYIANVVDHGDTPTGEPFLVMPWVEGRPLGPALMKQGPVSLEDALAIASRLLEALAYAHEHGIVHGDVKADNLLVAGSGPDLTVTLIDWGLARLVSEPATVATELVSGTPGYMAPEVLRGQPQDIASDIYAAGVVVYELLTGSAPFGPANSSDIVTRQLEGLVDVPSVRAPSRQIPTQLDHVVMRAIDRDAARRYPGARAFAKALGRGATFASGSGEIPLDALARTNAHELSGPTQDWRPPTTARRRLALGAGEQRPVGDEDAIATVSLRRASFLLGERRLRDSARELLGALHRLEERRTPPDVVWPVLLSLAAVQLGLGDRGAARRSAVRARELAIEARAEVGRTRADELLARIH